MTGGTTNISGRRTKKRPTEVGLYGLEDYVRFGRNVSSATIVPLPSVALFLACLRVDETRLRVILWFIVVGLVQDAVAFA